MRKMKESGASWIGKIPENWNIVPLKSKFNFGKGLSITKANLVETGHPVISYGQIHSKKCDGVHITNDLIRYVDDTYLDFPQSLVHSGGFIFADTSEDIDGCGNAIYKEDNTELFAGYHTIVLNPNSPENNKYLAYLFRTNVWRHQIREQLTEVKLYSISQKVLKETSILIPPLSEQHAIVAYLDEKCAAIDESIQKRKEIIEKLEDYKRATIIHTSLYGLNSKVDFKPTEIPWLKAVPSNWNVLPLRFMFIERKDKNKEGAETNLLSLSYGRIKRKDINSNEGLTPDNYNGYNIVQQGDIVLRLTDLQNDHRSLRTGLVTEKGIITSAYVTLKPLRANTNSSYYRYVLHAYDLMKVFYSMGEGIRQSLKYDDLSRTVLLPVPSEEEQENIVQYLREKETTIDAMISKQQTIIDKLEEYKKSIIYNAVTGKIDCRPS